MMQRLMRRLHPLGSHGGHRRLDALARAR
jgi:hypothetical protein